MLDSFDYLHRIVLTEVEFGNDKRLGTALLMTVNDCIHIEWHDNFGRGYNIATLWMSSY